MSSLKTEIVVPLLVAGWLWALAVVVVPVARGEGERVLESPAAPAWKMARTERLDGDRTVSLSEPVLVARSKGYLWFPSLIRRDSGDLLAVMSGGEDVHTKASVHWATWSGDGGLTWSELKQSGSGHTRVQLSTGEVLLLPYYLYPRPGGMGANYWLVPLGKQEIVPRDEEVIVTGLPRPDHSVATQLGMAGFVFCGRAAALKDGTYLAPLYGYFEGDRRYSLVAAQSPDGIHWRFRSTIADPNAGFGGEGPCEGTLCRLANGQLLCVFRNAGGAPYGQTHSSDEGKTWDKPVLMKDHRSVEPSLLVMRDRTVVLSGGRPGLFLGIDQDGNGSHWETIDVAAHHNACRPGEPILRSEHTSAYTELVALDERAALLIYDRIPHGWRAIPKDSADTNTVWVVRLEMSERRGHPQESPKSPIEPKP
jgi:hypothetical protein